MTAASAAAFSGVLPKTQSRHYSNPSSAPTAIAPCALRTSSPNLNLKLKLVRARRATVLCCSSTGPGGSSSGDSDSKNVLDAFFLGKALAEALNERIESTVGEFLSVVGRLQAEQQKQVQDFQEEVFERAKKAKERAARESMEGEGLVRKSTAASVTPVGGVASPNLSTSFSPSNSLPENDNPGTSAAEEPNGISEDPALGVSIE